jgi:hypothetical protein
MKLTDFPLRGLYCGTIAPAMKSPAVLALIALIPISSCRKPPAEVTVTETRVLTSKDAAPKLFASSDQRFRDAKPSPVRAETPEGWLAVPATQIRLLNYRFGESGLGEVWVSVSSGSVLDNVNRWLGQFNATKLDEKGLAELRSIPIAGEPGVWVEAEGDYARLHASSGSHLVRITLNTLEDRWRSRGFLRVHRSYLVALSMVTGLRTSGASTMVRLRVNGASPAVELPVSRRQTRELRDRLIRDPMRTFRPGGAND